MHPRLGPRLTLLTAGSGLGRSFVLDLPWCASTGSWGDRTVRPDPAWDEEPGVELCHRDQDGKLCRSPGRRQPEESGLSLRGEEYGGLVVNARVDGGFSVWDPYRGRQQQHETGWKFRVPGAFHFAPSVLWNGLTEQGGVVCNGLIRDWVSWQ